MARMDRTEVKMREIMNSGTEPAFAQLDHARDTFHTDYMKALNWIHNTVEPDALRGELETLLRSRKAEADVPYVADLDGVTLGVLGKIAYCLNRGARLAPTSVLRIRNALDEVRMRTAAQEPEQEVMDTLEVTAAGRINEVYKNCYSRIDNVKARMLNGKIELKEVRGEVEAVLEQMCAKGQVRKRLVQHYNESLQEALGDKLLKTWVKPLREIVKTLGGDVQTIKQRVKKAEAKAKPAKAAPKKAAAKTVKAAKPAARKPVKAKSTKTVTIKPRREAGVPTIAHQVRELIRVNKNRTTEQGMMEIVIRELGLSRERGRSVVKAFWNKVGA